MTATSLTQPLSGWEAFDQLLSDFRVTSPIDLKPDDQHLADPDEEVIAIELKSGQRYDLVYYSVGTQSESGKSIIRLCRTIEKEFAIRLGC